MDRALLQRQSEFEWRIAPRGAMRVPALIYASEALIAAMDHKVYEQLVNLCSLPGIVQAAHAMPDAHWGYGFPIGGVAAFDADSGVVSAGGVGFDISCGVRTLHTGLVAEQLAGVRERLADLLFRRIPTGLGGAGQLRLGREAMDAMLESGARWAVNEGFGEPADLERTEEGGRMPGADPATVSPAAKRRQRDQMGTLGSGNHYLEVQRVAEVHDQRLARAFGIGLDQVKVSIHCGSRGLGHQIGSEFLKSMVQEAGRHGIALPDRELACAPLRSSLGTRYLGAMRAAINCALANRQIITHLTREAFAELFPGIRMALLYDVSHNTCKLEEHRVEDRFVPLYVHRKGATRAFGPGHADLPPELRDFGQPVLIGGTMGTASYVLAGTAAGMTAAFGSACHGAGRRMSRRQALRSWQGEALVESLAARGISIRSPSPRGVAEEAPDAYKDVTEVVAAADGAGLARTVARLEPLICIKG